MLSDLVRIPFEWFVSAVWDRHGAIAGLLTAAVLSLAIIGLAWMAIKYGPGLLTGN